VRGLDIETQRINEYTELNELHGLIDAGQVIPVRDDDSHARVQQVGTAYVVDGLPLNVALGGDWIDGQLDVMRHYWDTGQVPEPDTVPGLDDDPGAREAAPAQPAAPDGRQLLVIGAAAALGYFIGRGSA